MYTYLRTVPPAPYPPSGTPSDRRFLSSGPLVHRSRRLLWTVRQETYATPTGWTFDFLSVSDPPSPRGTRLPGPVTRTPTTLGPRRLLLTHHRGDPGLPRPPGLRRVPGLPTTLYLSKRTECVSPMDSSPSLPLGRSRPPHQCPVSDLFHPEPLNTTPTRPTVSTVLDRYLMCTPNPFPSVGVQRQGSWTRSPP